MKHLTSAFSRILTAATVVLVCLHGSELVAQESRETNSFQNLNGPRRLLHQTIQLQTEDQKTVRSMPVELVEEHPDRTQGQRLYKYRLAGETNGFVLSREVWSPRHLTGFALVSAAPSRNYLVWLDGASICYLEVASAGIKPSSGITTGITSAQQADGVIRLDQFEGSEQFWGTRADNCELGVLSVSERLTGDLTLVVTNLFGKQFTFSSTRGEWRASGESGELKRRETRK